jgi:hypothetical protein
MGGIQKRLDIQVVGRQNDLEQHLLVNGDELLVPFADVCRALAGLILILVGVGSRQGLSTMVLAILQDLNCVGRVIENESRRCLMRHH